MLQKIPYQLAAKTILIVCAAVICFHMLIVTGVIPYTIVWGGRLTNSAEMLQFETVSITINLLIMLTVAVRSRYIPQVIPQKVVTVLLWFFAVMLVGNTVANVFSVTTFEKVVFTPMTFLLAVGLFRLIKAPELSQA